MIVTAPNATVDNREYASVAYVFIHEPDSNQWFEHSKLIPSNSTAFLKFDSSVAMDTQTIIIGTSWVDDPNGEYFVGAAYIFQWQTNDINDWVETTRLTPNETSATAFFGEFVFMSDQSIQIAAYGTTIGTKIGQGAVYLYQRDNENESVWLETRLITSDGSSEEHFGSAFVVQNGTKSLVQKTRIVIKVSSMFMLRMRQ